MIFEHSKYFFAKDNARHRGVDVRESMEDAIGVKSAVGNEAVDVGMSCKKITEGLCGEDEAG